MSASTLHRIVRVQNTSFEITIFWDMTLYNLVTSQCRLQIPIIYNIQKSY